MNISPIFRDWTLQNSVIKTVETSIRIIIIGEIEKHEYKNY